MMPAIGLEETSYRIKDDIANMKLDAEPNRALRGLHVKVEINTLETVPCYELVSLPT